MPIVRVLGVIAVLLAAGMTIASAQELSPYGSSKQDLHQYPVINVVFDANFADPKDLNILYGFVKNTMGQLKGRVVVVTHGPELRAFAQENYLKYQGIADRMKELADAGVEFRMCRFALTAAGYKADDFHEFVTVIPAGYPEIALLESQGYHLIVPLPHSPLHVRYLDHPELKRSE
jgi:intracellular sulfur oxidation DsrE/DsrF family protein